MCGICGLLSSDAPDPGVVEAMNSAILHRGPDHGAVESFGRCVLGYRRLAIVDLDHGDQPVRSERGDVVAVFNGELYNFRELRSELERSGHEIGGHGDSALIPHAYEQWGPGFAAHFEGMFAIALWDRAADRLVLARDQLGKKPLAYTRLGNGDIAFASEVKSLHRVPGFSRALDLAQLDAFLALQYTPRSGFASVERVPPGSYVVFEGSSSHVERYWRPAPRRQAIGEDDAIRIVRDEVTAAVRRRLVADVPLGALLSGGLDSSIVVATMAASTSEAVRTFTVGFPDRAYDERSYARTVAEHFGTHHEEITIDPQPELLQRLGEVFDEPFGDEAALPTLLVCEATRAHVKAALVGDGGDEVFGGYERYRAAALASHVPAFAGAAAAAALGRVRSARRAPRSPLFRARRLADVVAASPADRYPTLVEIFPLELRQRLWSDESHAHATRTFLPTATDPRLVDLESYLPGDVLPKADIASMAASLELRSPFLDPRVVEVGLALPKALAFGKVALKRAFADDLPPGIAERRKTGFGVPLDRWFRTDLREFAHELVLAGATRGLFKRAELERLLAEHASGTADHGHRIWCLASLELWQRRYVDGGAAR
jgi:asparagine synthase (glutamine-hydrolysing)